MARLTRRFFADRFFVAFGVAEEAFSTGIDAGAEDIFNFRKIYFLFHFYFLLKLKHIMSFLNWNCDLPREWQTNDFSYCFSSQLPIECIEIIRRYWIHEIYLLAPPIVSPRLVRARGYYNCSIRLGRASGYYNADFDSDEMNLHVATQ